MKVFVYYPTNNSEHFHVLHAFCEGILAAGDQSEWVNVKEFDGEARGDAAVVFGVGKKAVPYSAYRQSVLDAYAEAGKRTIVLEKGYIERDSHYAAGWDGLNGRADFMNADSPIDRVTKLGASLLQFMRLPKGPILLIGQVPWDASVQHLNHEGWLEETVRQIRKHTDRPIQFRPHPKSGKIVRSVTGCKTVDGALFPALMAASVVVTQNSNVAVDALLTGVPTFAMDEGSMAWPVANHSLDRIEAPEMLPREQWLRNLAYAQWTKQEMRTGEAWRHLRDGVFMPMLGAKRADGAPCVECSDASAP